MKDSILNLVLRRMAQGYEEQLPCYEQMLAIALKQEEVLREEEVNIDRLMELINRRQDIINSLEEMNGEIVRLKAEVCTALAIDEFIMSKIREKLTGPGVDDLAAVLERLAGIMQQIKELDKKNEETLRRRIKEIKDKLTELQNAKKANKAYQPNNPTPGGSFIDFSQ